MEILTFPKLLKPRMPILKSAPHTTLAQKYGNNNLTTISVIFGQWGVLYMKFVLLNLLSERMVRLEI